MFAWIGLDRISALLPGMTKGAWVTPIPTPVAKHRLGKMLRYLAGLGNMPVPHEISNWGEKVRADDLLQFACVFSTCSLMHPMNCLCWASPLLLPDLLQCIVVRVIPTPSTLSSSPIHSIPFAEVFSIGYCPTCISRQITTSTHLQNVPSPRVTLSASVQRQPQALCTVRRRVLWRAGNRWHPRTRVARLPHCCAT